MSYPDKRAVDALRNYLAGNLERFATSINSERRPEIFSNLDIYAFGDGAVPINHSLKIGDDNGEETIVTVSGCEDWSDVALAFGEVDGVGAQQVADNSGTYKLRIYSNSTMGQVLLAGGVSSSVYIGPDTTGANALFGFDPGGELVTMSPVIAPDWRGICDGEPDTIDLGAGFWVVFGDRTVRPRSSNIRDDTHIVEIKATIYAAEPNGNAKSAQEYLASCVNTVRTAIEYDRTLGGRVYLTELPSLSTSGKTFRFASSGGASPLISVAELVLRVTVFERS